MAETSYNLNQWNDCTIIIIAIYFTSITAFKFDCHKVYSKFVALNSLLYKVVTLVNLGIVAAEMIHFMSKMIS